MGTVASTTPSPEHLGSSTRSPDATLPSYFATLIAIMFDGLSIAAGTLLALLAYGAVRRGIYVEHEMFKVFSLSLQYFVAFVLFGRMNLVYAHEHSLLDIKNTANVLAISFFSLLATSVSVFFSGGVLPRLLLVFSWFLITCAILLQKQWTRRYFASLRAKSSAETNVLIFGTGPYARRIFSYLQNSPELRLNPVAFYEEEHEGSAGVIYANDYRFDKSAPVLTGSMTADLLRSHGIGSVFLADPSLGPQRISEIAELAAVSDVRLSLVGPTQLLHGEHAINFQVFDGLPVNSFEIRRDTGSGYQLVKRGMDIVISLFMLVLTLPAWAVAAIWVRLTSPGPILFRQERIGLNGRPFQILKFRSMYVDASKYARSPEDSRDPRITSAGRFLRKTSLDELPQLFNVLRGEMSLVGPRPEMPHIVAGYTPHEAQRLAVPQGLTGMWQLSADRRNAIHASIEYDLYYIQHPSVFLDLAIIIHTAAFAMKGI